MLAMAVLVPVWAVPVWAIGAQGPGGPVLDEDRFDESLLEIDESLHLGRTVPDVEVLTADGSHSLTEIISDRPTIVLLAYYSCGHVCPTTVRNLAETRLTADPSDYQVLVLSFDGRDTLETMAGVAAQAGDADNWQFGLLSAADIPRLTESVGFRFFFSERDQLFVHPAVLVFLSPEREVMRYLYGTEPRAGDIELALIESRNRQPRLNEISDLIRLTCFQFDATRSRYVLHPSLIFGGAGFGVLGLVGLAALASRKTSTGGS
jgi:protein SCO1/2